MKNYRNLTLPVGNSLLFIKLSVSKIIKSNRNAEWIVEDEKYYLRHKLIIITLFIPQLKLLKFSSN